MVLAFGAKSYQYYLILFYLPFHNNTTKFNKMYEVNLKRKHSYYTLNYINFYIVFKLRNFNATYKCLNNRWTVNIVRGQNFKWPSSFILFTSGGKSLRPRLTDLSFLFFLFHFQPFETIEGLFQDAIPQKFARKNGA